MRSVEEYVGLFEDYLGSVALAEELAGLADAMRYSLAGGGKRIRPVLCLACGEATGAGVPELLPAAAALELVHTFGMVHDDLPALDDDAVRRGRATSHVKFDEATAILNGDALLTQAFDLALSYPTPEVARELAHATLGMIGGQYEDVCGNGDLAELHALKTGRLFEAAIGCALAVSAVPVAEQRPWRAFAAEFGLLFQIVDDLLDGDGLAAEHGPEHARRLADETEARARTHLAEIPGDTSVFDELVTGLKGRAPAS